MNKSILIVISLYLINWIKSSSYNPFDALQWDQINLFEQISDDFKPSPSSSSSSSSYIGDIPGYDTVGFEVRTLDATGNHNNNRGSANSAVQRCMAPVYDDGFNEPNGKTRMSAREISNVISKQEPEESNKFVNDRFLTQFAWQWGQFLDHDITLISEERDALDLSLDIDIYVPCNDPEFDQQKTCDADIFIELFRTLQVDGTGTDINNPRLQTNEITSFIDGSMIYGSDDERGNVLRSGNDGKLDVTEDNFLPRNSGGIHNEPNDEERFVIAGDLRPNEQLGLLTMHTIWVRFHNILAEEVAESITESNIAKKEDDMVLFDEIVYQYTKLIVNAIIQKITYREWLPTMFGPTAISRFLGEYTNYDENVDPAACLIFSSAAYRLGHTLLPNFLPLREKDCKIWNNITDCLECDANLGGILLRSSFFVPEISENYDGFMEALLNGYSCTLANEVDQAITGAVRNFLFESAKNGDGQRLFGNLDLIAINLQRGREHGLPDYNSVRGHLGLDKFQYFHQISTNPEVYENFKVIYDDNIDDIDLFLGLIAEDHLNDGSFGETISGVVLQQFGRLRDGDRFWYQRYIKSGQLLDFIECITLKSVIELTTDIDNIDSIDSIQNNIFQNQRAISIFAGVETFSAHSILETNMIQKPQNKNGQYNIIQLTNIQLLSIFIFIIITISCICFVLYQYKKNQMNKYRPIKYDDNTETDIEASDREKL